MMRFIFKFLFLIVLFSNYSCTNKPRTKGMGNGELNETFKNNSKNRDIDQHLIEKEKLISKGWKTNSFKNGVLPDCYNYEPTYAKINNKLRVSVGDKTDVAIKLIDLKTDVCVRFVYVNAGTTYEIKGIPEGEYYLKIAYGKDWLSIIKAGRCIGKFFNNAIYEKGDEILNFNIISQGNSYQIPSFELKLDVRTSGIESFSSSKISESDFNE